MNNTAVNMELNLNYNKKKIFLADKHVPWEHEEYSKKKILSATLSGRKDVSKNIFESENISDIMTNTKAIKKATLLILDSLFNIIFDNESPGIFKDDPAVIDTHNIEFLATFFKNYPRTPLNIVKNSFMNNELFSILQTYLKRPSRQPFEYKDLKFFDSNSGVIRVNIVKSKLIDMYLLFAIVIYLFLLYVYLKGFKESINSLISFGDE